MHRSNRQRRGAALLIAVAILAILSVFAVVFSIQSRVDMNAATNFSNNVRADLMADAAVSITIAFLDHNRDVHPTITALDQAAFTYFNGTWIGGKWWAFNDPSDPTPNPTWLQSRSVVPFITADEAEALGEALYIPRLTDFDFDAAPDWDSSDSDDVFDPNTQPFLLIDPDGVTETRTRAEQSHELVPGVLFTDIDNDGDGFRDSMWIPIPADRIFGGVDQDGDGETDGIDNNFDGFVDEPGEPSVSVDEGGDGIDNDLDGLVDEAGEFALFVYWGGNDGLDNNGNNQILSTNGVDDDGDGIVDELLEGFDEPDERRIFLTAPLVVTRDEFGTNGLDDDGDSVVDEADESDLGVLLLLDGFQVFVNLPVLLDYADAAAPSSFAANWQTIEYNVDTDFIDNDYDFVANNDAGMSFNEPAVDLNGDTIIDAFEIEAAAQFGARRRGFNLINTNPGVYDGVGPVLGDFIAARGEPVCNIAGRVAILITDESSKVNIDIAGGHAYNEHFNPSEAALDVQRPLRRALSQGVGTHEYDLRVLPRIGPENQNRIWDRRMGGPTHVDFLGNVNELRLFSAPFDTADFSLAVPSAPVLDVNLPGYGGVDDNMSSLWMAVNGLDDDGDAEIYQNDGIDNDMNGLTDEPGEGALVGVDEGLRPYDYDGDLDNINDDGTPEYANFEGTDEPGEFQMFRPLRNVVLERLPGDDDGDENDLADEFGEASDRVFQSRDQLASVFFIDFPPGGEEASSRQVYTSMLRSNLVTAHSLDGGGRYQYFSRVDGSLLERPLLSGLKLNLNYAMATNPNNADDPGQIARMLMGDFYYPPSTADAQQFDLRIQLFDGNVGPIEYSFLAGMRQEDVELTRVPFHATPGTFGTLSPDQELRAIRLAANLQDFRDGDRVRTVASLSVKDDWWEQIQPPFIVDLPNRQIEYKASGVESIRINEIMVRPVRRIEAEATTDSTDLADPIPDFLYGPLRDPNLDGNFNFILPAGYPGGQQEFDFTVENYETGSPISIASGVPLAAPGASGWRLDNQVPASSPIGENTAFTTDRAVLTGDGFGRFDILQFRFRPSAGLPPGRYYLTMNFMDGAGLVDQQLNNGQIDYAIKYIAAAPVAWPGAATVQKNVGVTDILTDHHAVSANPPGTVPAVPWSGTVPALPDSLIGRSNHPAGARNTGWAFLGSNAVPNNLAIPFAGYAQNGAFTVEIPPFAGVANPVQVELCVAIRMDPAIVAAGRTLSINFFDFSQEPDHEYIEIVNIEEPPANLSADNVDDYATDLSGWQLEIGDSLADSNAIILRIPDGTLIAPGDSLVLGVNKFDMGIGGNGQTLFGDPRLDDTPDIYKNGMGLARGPRSTTAADNQDAFGWVTEPAIPPVDRVASSAHPLGINVPLNDNGNDVLAPMSPANIVGASVFFRPVDRDTIDTDGDGEDDFDLNAAEPLENSSLSTPESEPSVVGFAPTAFNVTAQDPTNAAKAWDRIVQLEFVTDTFLFDSENAASIGAFVLRGGVFPNYPELDGIDNDGDNAFLETDLLDNDGDFDLPDGFDNDNDGLLDETEIGGNGVDDDNDGFVDEPIFEFLENRDEAFEGVDEGFVRRYIRNIGALPVPVSAVPGSYAADPVRYTQLIDTGTGLQPAYLENVNQSPDWKAFVERRYNPGDEVIVTLYEGPVDADRVVDRVTYNQRDVENVAIDDDALAGFQLNPQLAQAWLPNTMGFDFYRSLERKHPLYAGDRFGTRNRWTATDGNYDDWSRGTNRFDELMLAEVADPQLDPLLTHGLPGSPLRMNFYARVLENKNNQFASSPSIALPVDPGRGWMYDRAKVRNRNLASAGDLMTLSHITFAHGLYADTASFETTPVQGLGEAQIFTSGVVPGPLVGMDFPKDLQALVTSTSFDELNLSVGQADFYPIYPTSDHVIANNLLARWDDTVSLDPPRAWSPVYMYPLGVIEVGGFVDDFTSAVVFDASNPLVSDPSIGVDALYSHLFATPAQTYPFSQYFMFQRADQIGKVPAGLIDDDMEARWPLDRRAVTYVSVNPVDFNPQKDAFVRGNLGPQVLDTEHPSEALFVWQGEDGLQNGRYDAYIVTQDNLDEIGFAHIEAVNGGGALLTNVGEQVVEAASAFDAQDMAIDAAFLTDLNGDRRCWNDALNPNGLPDRAGAINEINLDLPNPESYGLINGMVPTRDGIIHYGAIEVKNNYLALFVRNWGVAGAVNRITRVVLAPRRATSGRININTAVTRRVDNGDLFNPLMGIPGVMVEPGGFVNNSADIDLPTAVNQFPLADIPGLEVRTQGVIASRQERGVASTSPTLYPNRKREFETTYSLLGSRSVGGFFGTNDLQYPRSLYFGNVPALALSAADGEERFNEMKVRMSLMANFVTTRSDVFEIIVTAQPGYVADNNGDGVLNWRDDNEFVPTGEVKRRVIYERSQGDPDAARN